MKREALLRATKGRKFWRAIITLVLVTAHRRANLINKMYISNISPEKNITKK